MDPAPTWQPQDGIKRPALCEARGFHYAGLPQALVGVDGGDNVALAVLTAPVVHAGGGDDGDHPKQAQDEARGLDHGGGHCPRDVRL